MKYMFEDDERAPLSKLFMRAYDESVSKEFIYTRGNGRLLSKFKNSIDNNETYIVYLDMSPGNDSILRVYRKLRGAIIKK